MRCVVTGASGFVGSWLVRHLVRRGHTVLSVVRPTSNLSRLQMIVQQPRLAKASLDEIGELACELKRFQPDVVFHLAWWGGNSRKYVNDPSQIYFNVGGSLDLVHVAAESDCKCFIFMGTCVEYGKYNIPVNEVDPATPNSLYGYAKYGVEVLSGALCATLGMRFCGVRLFWAYGPMDNERRMIPYVINQLLKRQRPRLTPGEQFWDYVYIEDAVDALTRLAEYSEAFGIYNLGSGQPVTIRNVVQTIRDIIDPELPLAFGEVPYTSDETMHLEADIRRLTDATGWRPVTPLVEGLTKSVEWYRAIHLEDPGVVEHL